MQISEVPCPYCSRIIDITTSLAIKNSSPEHFEEFRDCGVGIVGVKPNKSYTYNIEYLSNAKKEERKTMLVIYYPAGKSIYKGVEYDNKLLAKDMLLWRNFERAKNILNDLQSDKLNLWKVEEVPGDNIISGRLVEITEITEIKKPREYWIVVGKKTGKFIEIYTDKLSAVGEFYEQIHVREVIE